jgi:hypothetical protein
MPLIMAWAGTGRTLRPIRAGHAAGETQAAGTKLETSRRFASG